MTTIFGGVASLFAQTTFSAVNGNFNLFVLTSLRYVTALHSCRMLLFLILAYITTNHFRKKITLKKIEYHGPTSSMNQSEIIPPRKSISQMLEKPIYLKINSPKLFIYWKLPCEEFFVFSLIAQAGRPIPLPTPKKGTQMFSFSSTKYGNVWIYLEKTLHLKRLSFQFPQKN